MTFRAFWVVIWRIIAVILTWQGLTTLAQAVAVLRPSSWSRVIHLVGLVEAATLLLLGFAASRLSTIHIRLGSTKIWFLALFPSVTLCLVASLRGVSEAILIYPYLPYGAYFAQNVAANVRVVWAWSFGLVLLTTIIYNRTRNESR